MGTGLYFINSSYMESCGEGFGLRWLNWDFRLLGLQVSKTQIYVISCSVNVSGPQCDFFKINIHAIVLEHQVSWCSPCLTPVSSLSKHHS
jgi:hypothetical protein